MTVFSVIVNGSTGVPSVVNATSITPPVSTVASMALL